MNPLTEQRAWCSGFVIGRGSMTRATKLARTTPKTLKSYLSTLKESNGLSKTADLKLFAHLNRKDLK